MTREPLTVVDWRRVAADVVMPLVHAEMAAWRAELAWDVQDSWSAIEPARAQGRLPGVVVFDEAGMPAGWACYLRHRDALQVAMIVAESAAATRQLVDAIAASPEAAGTAVHIVFARDAAPGLAPALAARAFDVAGYRYRGRATAGLDAGEVAGSRAWQPDDVAAFADLCARAYESSTELRAFAPRGTAEEWTDYAASLVAGTACGRIVPDASRVIPGAGEGRLDGAVLVTSLGHGVAHIAQVAVDPDLRRHGVGRTLLAGAIARARGLGHTEVTLLVAERNAAAGALYDVLGFEDRGRFVAAVNAQPRRSTSVALETGGASTRR